VIGRKIKQAPWSFVSDAGGLYMPEFINGIKSFFQPMTCDPYAHLIIDKAQIGKVSLTLFFGDNKQEDLLIDTTGVEWSHITADFKVKKPAPPIYIVRNGDEDSYNGSVFVMNM